MTTMKSAGSKTAMDARWTAGAIMTAQPVTIGRKELLTTADHMMRTHRIHHLPVLEHGDLVGLVSQRDLVLVESLRGVDTSGVVEEAMSTDVYAVAPDVPIATVAKHMARNRYGSAVVMERGRVIGIFTVTDALRLVSALAPLPAASVVGSSNAAKERPKSNRA